MRSVYSRASASHCVSPGSSVLTVCLFPSLISSRRRRFLGGSRPLASRCLVFRECRDMQPVLSLAASAAPCWLRALPGGSGARRAARPLLAAGGAAGSVPPTGARARARTRTRGASRQRGAPGNVLTLRSHVAVVLIFGKRRGTDCVSTVKLWFALHCK